MLNRLKKMIDGLGTSQASHTLPEEDQRLAAAALLVHATLIDGHLDPAEEEKLHELLQAHYQLSEGEAIELIELAREEESRAVDLYGFTRKLTKTLEPDERLKIIEMLWEIACSDGVLNEFEENLVWRVAELMHVAPRERIRLRQMVKARSGMS